MKLKSYRDLKVWRKAMDLVVEVYRLSRGLPLEERYGLVSQMQRSAVSVPANIAEGYGRTHRGDYLRHLSVAQGSLAELETHLTIAARLKYLPREEVTSVWRLAQEVGKMLGSLLRSLERESRQQISRGTSQTLDPSP